jgi:16S rRNA (adenine(1408)-N(1))-methyltransferase
MRILQGTALVDAPPDWRKRLQADGRPVVLDLGAGDGRFVYESARKDTGSIYVAVDPDGDTLREYAYRAARKPARGGVDNAFFVVGSLEMLPDELLGVADRVRINFPWGSLMRGLLEPRVEALQAVASLVKPGGGIEIVMSYDPAHDTGAFSGEPLPPLEHAYIDEVLAPAYADAGFNVIKRRRLGIDEALGLESTWGRRLLHARPREVYFLACVPRASR